MLNTSPCIERLKQAPLPFTAGNGEPQRSVRMGSGQSAANPFRRRRFDRVFVGFWFGGIVLGTVGCILGVSMPYHHPVAVAISVLWWSIYCGCFGASIGALVGLFSEHSPALASAGPKEAEKLPAWEDLDSSAIPTELTDRFSAKTGGCELFSPRRITETNFGGEPSAETHAMIKYLRAEVAQLRVMVQTLQQEMQMLHKQN